MAKQMIAKRVHVSPTNAEGSRSALADETRLELQFFDGDAGADGKPTVGTVLTISTDDIPALGDTPEGLVRQAVFHGLSQKWGDVFSKADGVADAAEKAEEMRDRLIAGEWLTPSEGGSERGNTLLRQAILEVFQKNGKNVDPETEAGQRNIERIDAELADKDKAKGWKARADVAAAYEALRAERAAEKAKKARAAAKGAEVGGLEDFE